MWRDVIADRGLTLRHNAFKGTFPSDISNLTALASFDVGWNSMIGTVPAGITRLTTLTYVAGP